MLTAEQNEALTRVGAGTPMGELLRRYWFPVALTADLEDFPVRKARLLGEDFVVFKTPAGNYGILDEQCPHRRASLTYGMVDGDGIRCSYHGWRFDRQGACLDQPAEPDQSAFKGRIKARAGQARELGGLVWAYVGPLPVPELPRYDVYVMEGLRDVGHVTLPCNFVQIMENAVDPHHVEWLHGRYFEFLARQRGFEAPPSFGRKHARIAFDPFPHGIIKRRLYEGQSEEADDWKVGHPLVFPYKMRVGGGGISQMQIRVPVDDTTTWFILYTVHHPRGAVIPSQARIPAYELPWRDERGRIVTDYVEGQDFMAWVSQGMITDRTMEHIGKSDIGIVTLRRMYREQMAAVAEGRDPLAVVRQPHERIDLPCERDKFGAEGTFALEWINQGFARYSPQVDALRWLHTEAAEAAGSGVSPGTAGSGVSPGRQRVG